MNSFLDSAISFSLEATKTGIDFHTKQDTGYGPEIYTGEKELKQALFSYLKLRVALKEQYLIIYNNIHQFLTV